MIRMILISAAFIGVSVALVVIQPGAMQGRERMADAPDPSPVTRAAASPNALPGAIAQSGVPAPAANRDVSAVLAALVRDAQEPAPQPRTDALANPALAITAAVRAAQQPKDGDLANTTKAILADLNRASSRRGEDDALLAMTQGVLGKLSGTSEPAGRAPQVGLQTLVVQALRQGQSDAYLDALLNEARDTGQVVVPEALITSDNKVDTATLLASLVQQSVGSGAPARAATAPATTYSPSRPRARPFGGTEIYVVQPGDSLAAISYRFYGDTLRYTEIFEANRDKITTPDKIRIGQKLTIPVL